MRQRSILQSANAVFAEEQHDRGWHSERRQKQNAPPSDKRPPISARIGEAEENPWPRHSCAHEKSQCRIPSEPITIRRGKGQPSEHRLRRQHDQPRRQGALRHGARLSHQGRKRKGCGAGGSRECENGSDVHGRKLDRTDQVCTDRYNCLSPLGAPEKDK